MTVLPDLTRFDRVAIDTETSGLGFRARPVGLSWATPDGARGYASWAHEGGGNNVTVDEVRAWAAAELRPDLLKVFFNAAFDLRMLAYTGPGDHDLPGVGVRVPGRVEDAGIVAPVLNENDDGFSLDAQMKKYCGVAKDDAYLNEWCAAQFGGRPTRNIQAPRYWRVPREVIAEYAEHDAGGTLALFDARRPLIDTDGLAEVYAMETALIPILLEMHLCGVRVDVAGAGVVKAMFEERLAVAMRHWEELAPGVNPLSTDQIAPVFAAAGLPVGRTEAGHVSLTKEGLEDIDHPLAGLVMEIREASKYAGTFVQAYLLDNADANDVIHGEFHQLPNAHYGTVSGRFSSGGALNLQNLPGDKHPDLARLIRGLFIPYLPGLEWVKADYSQIEYRFLAHYAGGVLARAYKEEPDVDFHEMLTRMIYAADELADPTIMKARRRRTKNTNFAIVYGAGLTKAAATAGVSVEEMKQILVTYHDRTQHAIHDLTQKAIRRAGSRGYITTWGGRRRRFRTAEWARAKGWRVHRNERYVETHKALNALLQGSAADLLKAAMIRVAPLIDWRSTFLHLTIHDELDISAPPIASDEGRRFHTELRERMEGFPLSSGVPIRVDVKTGANWGTTV